MVFNIFNINNFNFRSADFQCIWRSKRVFGHVMRHCLTLVQYDLPNIRTTRFNPHDITNYFSVHGCLLSSEKTAVSIYSSIS